VCLGWLPLHICRWPGTSINIMEPYPGPRALCRGVESLRGGPELWSGDGSGWGVTLLLSADDASGVDDLHGELRSGAGAAGMREGRDGALYACALAVVIAAALYGFTIHTAERVRLAESAAYEAAQQFGAPISFLAEWRWYELLGVRPGRCGLPGCGCVFDCGLSSVAGPPLDSVCSLAGTTSLMCSAAILCIRRGRVYWCGCRCCGCFN